MCSPGLLFGCLAVVLSASAVAHGDLGEECTGDPNSLLQQKLSAPKALSPQSLNADSVHDEMLRTIETEFQGLSGGSVKEQVIRAAAKNAFGVSWQACASVDYSSSKGLHSDAVHEMIQQIGLEDLRDEGDATYSAFIAGYNTMMSLRKLDANPRFQNYTLVNWLQPQTGFASWGSAGNQVGEVDYSVRPPAAEVLSKHAGDGFALCEFTQTILKQSNHQLLNNCGPTAVLAALVIRSPALAFKKSLQLYYTGALPEMDTTPCPYVYEQQPGLIPFNASTPGYNAFPAGTNMCPGVMLQTEGSGGGGQCQPVGIQRMWTTSMLDTYEQKMRREAGLDDGCSRSLYESLHPEEPTDKAQLTRNSMLVGAAAVVYTCSVAFGAPCTFISPAVSECMQQLNLDEAACTHLLTSKGASLSDSALVTPLAKQAMGSGNWAPVEQMIDERPTLTRWLGLLNGTSTAEKVKSLPVLMNLAMNPSSDGEATAAMMAKACNAEHAMLAVNGAVLEGQPGGGPCDHCIFLEGCEGDSYQVWSWGVFYTLPKASFHASICSAVIH
ncbi:unnamed protein product [Polarella glacialis]|uniref:Uncharacterized protein n=1 Tax=Polarella glacialis TaxID=89957 RepID=A0A813FNM5_POLGL|nr:unnamed protein product [Polarella glacialis]